MYVVRCSHVLTFGFIFYSILLCSILFVLFSSVIYTYSHSFHFFSAFKGYKIELTTTPYIIPALPPQPAVINVNVITASLHARRKHVFQKVQNICQIKLTNTLHIVVHFTAKSLANGCQCIYCNIYGYL